MTFAAAIAIVGLTAGGALAQQQAPRGAQGQAKNLAFCLQKTDGSKNCGFTTMAQCDAAKKGQGAGATCVRNAQTTGSGMAPAKPSGSPSQPSTGMTPSNPSGGSQSSSPSGMKK
jgi:hypothetical protein